MRHHQIAGKSDTESTYQVLFFENGQVNEPGYGDKSAFLG